MHLGKVISGVIYMAKQVAKIQWTDTTWNPVRGCSRISEGCRNCKRLVPFLGLRDVKGGDITEWPADIRVRQTPREAA